MLAGNDPEGKAGALVAGNVLGRITEVELRQTAVQVSSAPIVIGADHATLERRRNFSAVE